MRPIIHCRPSALLLAACLACFAQAQERPVVAGLQPAWSDRMTDDQLRELQRKPSLVIGEAVETTAPRQSAGFVETSDFISFNNLTTFVPKGAIMHVPERLRGLLVEAPTGKLVLWNEFVRHAPALVAPFEITLREASGRQSIEPQRLDAQLRSDRIVVAVIRGNPVSVAKPLPATANSNP